MRPVSRSLGLLLLVPLTLLVGVNTFLNAGLPLLLSRTGDAVRISYDVAWMLVPGVVEVRELRIHSRSERDEVTIEVDRVSGVIELPRLLDRTFHAHTLRARGASFTFDARPDGPPAQADPWRIELADVVIDEVRDLRVEGHRYAGDARVTARAFTYVAERHVAVTDATLTVVSGEVRVGDATMVTDLRGTVGVTLDGVNPAEHPDRALLRFLSGHAALDADVRSLAFLGFYLRGAPWLAIGGGAGELHVDARVERGAMQVGSGMKVAMRDIGARFLSFSIAGDGDLSLAVEPGGDGALESRLVVDFGDYAITRDGDAAPHVKGRGFQVTARTADVALDAAFTSLDVVFTLPKSEVPDVRVYDTYLPRGIGLALQSGSGTVHGQLSVSTPGNVGSGELFVTGKRVTATLDALTIVSDLSLHAVVSDARLDEGRYSLAGTRLSLTEGSVTDPSAPPRDASSGWWATVELPRGHAISGAPVFLDADLTVRLRDTVPFVSVFAQKQRLPAWVRGLLSIRDVSGEARLRLGEEVLHLPSFEVRGGKGFALSLQLRRKQLSYVGKLHARYAGLSLGMQLLGEENRIQLFDSRKWYDALAAVE